MDEQALERARQRIAAGAADGLAGPRLDAALERARAEIMRLAHVADELEESLPKQVETAMRDGIAREVVPVSRSLAEIRGSVEPGAPAARTARAGAARRAELADRRPRDPRRPHLLRLERRRRAPRPTGAWSREPPGAVHRAGRGSGVAPTRSRARRRRRSPTRRPSRAVARPRRGAFRAPRRGRAGAAGAGSGRGRRRRTAPWRAATASRAP